MWCWTLWIITSSSYFQFTRCYNPRPIPHASVQCEMHSTEFIHSLIHLFSQQFFFLKSRAFKKKLFILFIYFWPYWVFVAAHGLSLVAASGGYSSLRCAGFSLRWLLLLRSMGSRRAWASVVVARGL